MNFNIPFMSYRRFATIGSLVLLLISVGSLSFKGLNLGLDFSGGTLIEVSYEEAADLVDIRDLMTSNGFDDFQVVNFGSNSDVLIKVADKNGNSQLGDVIYKFLQDADPATELKRIEFVGPQVGDELREQGGLAMLLALALVMLYVAFRFQYKFAVGALAALVHDVFIVLGFFSILDMEFDLTVLAALLAVIGYSLNDTIVVSDRIRENFRKLRRINPEEVINISLTETLGRTLVTSLTTMLVLISLALLGGEMIHGFSIALLVGVITGTYSSIYVAANTLLALGVTEEDLMIPVKEGADQDELIP